MSARKKFKPCGHLSYGNTCARCREADRLETGYVTKKKGIIVEPNPTEAARLRQPTHNVNSKYRQRVVAGNYDN